MRFLFLPVLAALALSTFAADRPSAPIRLSTGPAPGALGEADKDIPTLTPFWADADKATGAVFVVCPGGGYMHLAPHEGDVYARWLNTLGISAFVLKYRLAGDGYRVPTILLD